MADDISTEVEEPQISVADLGLGESNEVVDEHIDETEVVNTDDAVLAEKEENEKNEVQTEVTNEEVVDHPVPQSWKKEYEEHWDSLSPEVQEIFERREKQMHEGLEQYKEHSSYGKQMRDIITPYEAFLAQQGVDGPKALEYLLGAHYKLTNSSPEDKKQYLATLAKEYNIDLGDTSNQGNTDPTIKALQDQLAGIQHNLSAQERSSIEQKRTQAVSEVEEFAKDRPYFDEVSDQIVAFINSGDNLEDAYEKAVWANPVTRQKELAKVQTESEKTLQEKAKAEALAAKKSRGTNVRGRDTQKTPTETKGTMEDTMRDTLQEIRGRTH